LQCTPVSPACLLCPLADGCAALATGQVDRLPVRQKAPEVQVRRFDYIYVRYQGRTAIRRRGPGDIWQGLYEPLVCDQRLPGEACDCRHSGLDPESPPPQLLKSGVKHQLTHRTLIVDFYLWEPAAEPALPEGYVWIEEAELDRYAKPRLFELMLKELE
ncbi:MAG: NUDIX domain-containing protein, partial [Bacteroidales bacterium]|nr:NUDIX domain-containing protein [Bacteroidales bacterium]